MRANMFGAALLDRWERDAKEAVGGEEAIAPCTLHSNDCLPDWPAICAQRHTSAGHHLPADLNAPYKGNLGLGYIELLIEG